MGEPDNTIDRRAKQNFEALSVRKGRCVRGTAHMIEIAAKAGLPVWRPMDGDAPTEQSDTRAVTAAEKATA